MAFYVRIEKIQETAGKALYRFSGNRVDFGTAELDTQSGEVRVVKRARNDRDDNFFLRTAAKLRQEWRCGSVPTVTEWAS